MSIGEGANRLFLIGLTGGIGSGKSTVGKMVEELGIPVLDADRIAREVVEPGLPAFKDIQAGWPEAIGADGRVDRGRLASIVFSNPEARARLETITHPRIREAGRAAAEALAGAGHPLAFYEASLLVEAGRHGDFDALVVVSVPQTMQIARAAARGEQSEEQILARLATQLPLAEKVKLATHVIDNSGDLAATRVQVEALVRDLRARFADERGGPS